jgi:hypothetical protein
MKYLNIISKFILKATMSTSKALVRSNNYIQIDKRFAIDGAMSAEEVSVMQLAGQNILYLGCDTPTDTWFVIKYPIW